MFAVDTPGAAASLRPLVELAAPTGLVRGGRLPEPLRRRYGGDLAIPLDLQHATIVANFVSTLDGVVSYNTREAAGGGEISGFFEPDRFVMGLLRALADVVLIGAGTLRAAPTESWTPAFIDPEWAGAYAALRHELGLAAEPVTAVVTASGDIDPDHPGLGDPRVPVLLITSETGRRALARRRWPKHVLVEATGGERRVDVASLPGVLGRRGAGLVVCEGGPQLLGQLLREELLDELFLTIAPQIAGRSPDNPRIALVEGASFRYGDAPWARLLELRQAGDHLFTRYRLKGGRQ